MNWNRWILVLTIMFSIISPAYAKSASISDLWFMRGKWQADLDNLKAVVKEEWIRTDDKTLAGTCLFIEEFIPGTSEAMQIIETDGGIILKIKHTNKDGKPWLESNEAGDLKLVEYDLTHAVFDNCNQDNRVVITYKWLEKGKLSTLVEVTKENKKQKFGFNYERRRDMKDALDSIYGDDDKSFPPSRDIDWSQVGDFGN